MNRCETCRWWERDFTAEQPEARVCFEGDCRHDENGSKGAWVLGCDHDFGCVLWEEKGEVK